MLDSKHMPQQAHTHTLTHTDLNSLCWQLADKAASMALAFIVKLVYWLVKLETDNQRTLTRSFLAACAWHKSVASTTTPTPRGTRRGGRRSRRVHCSSQEAEAQSAFRNSIKCIYTSNGTSTQNATAQYSRSRGWARCQMIYPR